MPENRCDAVGEGAISTVEALFVSSSRFSQPSKREKRGEDEEEDLLVTSR